MPKITRPSLATECNWSEKSEKSAAHDIPATQPIPCIVRRLTTTSQVHQLVHLQHDARADAHLRRFDHPAISMFLTPGPSFSRSISM